MKFYKNSSPIRKITNLPFRSLFLILTLICGVAQAQYQELDANDLTAQEENSRSTAEDNYTGRMNQFMNELKTKTAAELTASATYNAGLMVTGCGIGVADSALHVLIDTIPLLAGVDNLAWSGAQDPYSVNKGDASYFGVFAAIGDVIGNLEYVVNSSNGHLGFRYLRETYRGTADTFQSVILGDANCRIAYARLKAIVKSVTQSKPSSKE